MTPVLLLSVLLVAPSPTVAPAPAPGPTPAPAPVAPPSVTVLTAAPSTTVPTLTLGEAIEALVAQNPDLESAQAAIDDAEAVAQQALAAVKPILVASGSYTRNNDDATIDLGQALGRISQSLAQVTGQPLAIDAPGEMIIQPLQNLSASGQLQVPLFAAHAYWDIRAARASVRARRGSHQARLVQLRGALTQAAWLAGAAEAMVAVAQRAARNAEAHWQTSQRLFTAGQATRLSVDQAQLQVVRRQSDLAQARSELERAQLSLGVMLGRDTSVRIDLASATIPDPTPADLDLAVDEAVARRAELHANRADQAAARERIRSAKMRLLPTLTGTAVASTSTVAYPTGLNYAWQVGLSLRWTIYDGGVRRATRRRAEAGLRQARAEQRRLELQVGQQVRDATRQLALARDRFALAEQEVALATQAAASAERSFAQGRAQSLDVLDALDSSFQAELRREQARAQLAAAAAELRTAQGSM